MSILHLSSQELSKIKPPYVFLDTAKKDKKNQKSLLFRQIKKILTFKQGDNPQIFFKQAESWLKKGFWLCGYFNYEFGYFLEESFYSLRKKSKGQLAWLAVAEKPEEVNFSSRKGYSNQWAATEIKSSLNRKDYKKNILQIKKFLEEGLTYQVNYTFKINFKFRGDETGFYRDLRRRQPTPYLALIKTKKGESFLSFSPELFFRMGGGKIETYPMKGTAERGENKTKDKKNKRDLIVSPKVRAENIMIVDLLRNDLGRIANWVGVPRLFKVERHQTLYQMISVIEGGLKKGISLHNIFKAVFPCGSVTGAPKIKTMQIINKLENYSRGIYTGAIGYISPQKKACFNVAIRTISLKENKGELGVGGGIVYDSAAEAEYKEALLKADFLKKSLPKFYLIESLLWSREKGFWLLDLHIKRLAHSCKYFSIPFYPAKIKDKLKEKTKKRKKPSKLRLTVDSKGKITVSARQLTKLKLPAKARISPQKIKSENIFLRHKTSQRDFYNRQRKKALAQGVFETLFLNQKGELTEGTITNIFLAKNNKLYTPPVSCGVLAGVLRQYLLEKKKVFLKKLYLKDLRKADKIYLGNSVRGLFEAKLVAADASLKKQKGSD